MKLSNKWRCNQHTSADQTEIPCVPWIKAQGEDVNSGRPGAHKPDKIGLSCKANKCSDAGTGDLGVLSIREISPWLVMPAQPAPDECSHKCK